MLTRCVYVNNVEQFELRELDVDLEHVKRELGYEIEFCYFAYYFILSNDVLKEISNDVYYLETDISNARMETSEDGFEIKLEELDVMPVLVKDNIRYIMDVEHFYQELSLDKMKEFEISKKMKHITKVATFNIMLGSELTPLDYKIDSNSGNLRTNIHTDFIHYGCEYYALNTMIDMCKNIERYGNTFRFKPFKKRDDIFGTSLFYNSSDLESDTGRQTMKKWLMMSDEIQDLKTIQSSENTPFPPMSQTIEANTEPVKNSSKIIRQMALLGSGDYIVVDEKVPDSIKTCYDFEHSNYENIEGIVGDENRVYCTRNIKDMLNDLNLDDEVYISKMPSKLNQLLIVGHYEDVKAYVNTDEFNELCKAYRKRYENSGYAITQLVGDMVTLHLVSLNIHNTIDVNSIYLNRTIDSNRLMRNITLFQDKNVIFNDFETTLQTLLKCYDFINTDKASIFVEEIHPKVVHRTGDILKNPKIIEILESL